MGIFNQFSDSLLAPGQIRYLFHLLLYYYSFKDKQLCFRVKTHPLALISGFLSSSARESRASAQERITLGGEDHPLWNCSCSCQGVANKHQIYVHFERSTFTIGFLSGAVARERAPPRGAAWVLAPGSLELGAHRGALWAVPRAASPAAAAVPKLGYWRRCTDTRLWPPAPAAAAQRTNEPLPAISPRWQRCGKLSRWSRAAGLDGVLSSPRSCLSWQSLAGVPCFLLSTPFGLAAHPVVAHRCAREPRLQSSCPESIWGQRRGCLQPRGTVFSQLTHLFLYGVSSTNPNPGLPGEKQDRSSV